MSVYRNNFFVAVAGHLHKTARSFSRLRTMNNDDERYWAVDPKNLTDLFRR